MMRIRAVGQHPRYLADRGDNAAELPANVGSQSHQPVATHGDGSGWRATARSMPTAISAGDPNLTGVEYVVNASSAPNTSAAKSALAVQPM